MAAAAARAVDRLLSSEAAFEVLVARLEAAGWRIERQPGTRPNARRPSNRAAVLTPAARPR